MTKMHKVEVELTEEEAKDIRALLESGNEDEIAKMVERVEQLASLRQIARDLREKLLRDVVLNAHHWLHEGDSEKALMLLCPMVTILEGEMPPGEVVRALVDALNFGNMERAKHDCAGSA